MRKIKKHIEAVKAAEFLSKKLNLSLADLVDAFADIPTADVAEVVRCKNCIHRHSSEFCECRDENAYCSDGELKPQL